MKVRTGRILSAEAQRWAEAAVEREIYCTNHCHYSKLLSLRVLSSPGRDRTARQAPGVILRTVPRR